LVAIDYWLFGYMTNCKRQPANRKGLQLKYLTLEGVKPAKGFTINKKPHLRGFCGFRVSVGKEECFAVCSGSVFFG
jgi:hypothetical protein